MEKPIEIKLAEKMGFCFGVKRAVGGVMTLKGNVDMLGPLIHNPQFVKKLEERGIRVVNDMTQISANRVIIRAHGLSNKLIEELKQKGLKIIDLTCPLVKSVQNHAKRMEDGGREVFIVGEKGHQEVETIKENLKNGLIISTLEEAKSLPFFKKIGVVAQTTQRLEHFEKIGNELKKHSEDVMLINTICNATRERQNSALKLAKEVNLMIVVGGYNSANTKQLAVLCHAIVETKHIETENELEKGWFKNKKIIGITAGASTPDSMIKKVTKKIKTIT